jgi:hypothetical protein
MTSKEHDSGGVFDTAATQAVDLGNRLADGDPNIESRDVASGLLAGAVQYWLYAYQPCGEAFCESCADLSTAEQRLRLLLEEVKQLAETSDYFHSPRDSNVGTA